MEIYIEYIIPVLIIIVIYFIITKVLSTGKQKSKFILYAQNPDIRPPGYPTSLTLTENHNFPTCDTSNIGCISNNSDNTTTLYPNVNYTVTDGRCFKPISSGINRDRLTEANNRVQALNVDSFFRDCTIPGSYMYRYITGRFVRLSKTGNGFIKLNQFEVYGTTGFIRPVNAYAKPVLTGANYFLLMIAGNATATITGTGVDPYIQLDLGDNIEIRSIKIIPTADDPTALSIIGSRLLVIQDTTTSSGTIKYERTITPADISVP
jgi:hypothetical protein